MKGFVILGFHPGLLSIMDYTRVLRPKGVPFSD